MQAVIRNRTLVKKTAIFFWGGQSQKYVTIGSAQCRHRPAGGQPGRDVAVRTSGAEHPTTVFVGCGACKIEFLNVHTFGSFD